MTWKVMQRNAWKDIANWKPQKFQQQRQQWTRSGKMENIPAWQLTEVRKKRCSKKQGQRAEKFISRHWWIFVISRIRLYSEATLWKMFQDHTRYSLNKDHQHHWWQPQKSWSRTRSRCSIRSYPGQNGRCTDVIENSKAECLGIWIRPPKHKWPKSLCCMEDPVVPLERNLYGHPLAGPLWERQFEKVLEKLRLGKVPNW